MFFAGKLVLPLDAAAPNNAGSDQNSSGNGTSVKQFKARGKTHTYISAQSFKRMVRDTIFNELQIPSSPVERQDEGAKQKVMTAGKPDQFLDDDLFGYMRTQKKDKGKGTDTTLRVAPYSQGTLVSIAPVNIAEDFGVMSRDGKASAIFSHQFYSADLAAPFMIDMSAIGTFQISGDRANYLASDTLALIEQGATEIEWRGMTALRLPVEERRERLSVLLQAFGLVSGGAMNSLHYQDKVPALILGIPMRGGINPLDNVFGATERGEFKFRTDVLRAELKAYNAYWDAPLVVGWRPGWAESEATKLQEEFATEIASGDMILDHPATALNRLAKQVEAGDFDEWLN